MIERNVQSRKRYILSLLIGTILFLLIIGASYSFAYLQSARISSLQQQTVYSLFEAKVSSSFFDEDICEDSTLKKISEELAFQGRTIDDLENKFGKNDKRVLAQKKFYTLVLLDHLDFIKKRNAVCDEKINTILFFYSNEGIESEYSEDVGELLDFVYSENSNLLIYSFDVNLDSEVMEKLIDKYNVSSSPTVLINEKDRIYYPKNVSAIEYYFE